MHDPRACGGRPKFLHDGAGCFRAIATQQLFDEQKLDRFPPSGVGRWPAYSRFLNPAENLGALVIEKAEEHRTDFDQKHLSVKEQRDILIGDLTAALESVQNNTAYLTNLIKSFKRRLDLCE